MTRHRGNRHNTLRVKALAGTGRKPISLWLLTGIVLLTLIFLLTTTARAQNDYPRVGLSVSPDHYSEEITIVEGEEFTLYACVFGIDDETPLSQPLSSVSWVIHQVCCGSTVDIVDVVWNDEFVHEGHPILGVTSTPIECMDRDSILLATITAILHDPVPGGGLWAAGPYDASFDCQGEMTLFEGLPVSILVDDTVTPVEPTSFGGVKALYR